MTDRRPAWLLPWAVASLLTSVAPAVVYGHPEFVSHVEKVSERSIDCALCHRHPDGPEGGKQGQIGSLSSTELDTLGRARAVFEPHRGARNPILNDFGNSLLDQLGKKRVLELRRTPALLHDELTETSDLDGDGISDRQELRDGTHPLDAEQGDPLRLLVVNLTRNAFDLLMAALATLAALYGLSRLLTWFHRAWPDTNGASGDRAAGGKTS